MTDQQTLARELREAQDRAAVARARLRVAREELALADSAEAAATTALYRFAVAEQPKGSKR